MFSRKRLPNFIALLFLALASVAVTRGDELHLANGDRISGKLISNAGEQVVFESTLLGRLTVAAPGVAKLIVTSGEAPGLAAQSLSPSPSQAPVVTPPPTPGPPPKGAEPDGRILTAKMPKPDWKGKVELGYRQVAGKRDSTSLDLRASAERKSGNNDLKAAARLLYGEQDDRINNERYDGSFRWRRELGQRTFAQSLTSYYRDPLKEVWANWEQNVGAGYKLLKANEHIINVGAGLTAQFRESDVDDGNIYTLVELFQDYTFQINKRVKLSQNAVAQYSPDSQSKFVSVGNQPSASAGEANYKVRFDTTLQGQLTDSISLNLRYEYEFDNAIATESAKGDQRITSSIGYGF